MNLTEDQKKQLTEILDETKHKLEELQAEARSGAKDSRAEAQGHPPGDGEKLTQESCRQTKGKAWAALP